jgi:D-alanyl-D-alanine carboxypeptidase (penicillin-binding protein 5/6)
MIKSRCARVVFSFCFSVSFLLAAVFSPTLTAAESANEDLTLPEATMPSISNEQIVAESALLFDMSTGRILYERNPDTRRYPASVTKMMTALLALEKGNLADEVTITEEMLNVDAESTLAGFVEGETVTLKDLVYGTMLPSGNEAAKAIAMHIAGSEAAFVEMMNARAAEIGMENTKYANAHGLHDEGHYTTAADLQKLLLVAYKNPLYRKVSSTETYTVEANDVSKETRVLVNTNRMISSSEENGFPYEFCTGGKTGFTDQAGNCIVASAEKDGVQLGVVVLKSEGYDQWRDAIKLFYYGFENYKTMNIVQLFNNARPHRVTVDKAASSDVASGSLLLTHVADDGGYIVNSAANIQFITEHLDDIELITSPAVIELQAPVAKGDVVGTFEYRLGKTVLATGNIVATRDVAAPPKLFEWYGEGGFSLLSMHWIVYVLFGGTLVFGLLLIMHSRARKKLRKRKAALRGQALPNNVAALKDGPDMRLPSQKKMRRAAVRRKPTSQH